MSNYSKIILCWSGIDHAAEPTDLRLDEINTLLKERYEDHEHNEEGLHWFDCTPIEWHVVSYGAGMPGRYPPGTTTMACEVVAVGSMNHWRPDALLWALGRVKWERPEEVELFWKEENHHSYQRCTLPVG